MSDPGAVDDFAIVNAMEDYGGSFARAIAEAARRADEDNMARLKAAFPDLWAEYASLATMARTRRKLPEVRA